MAFGKNLSHALKERELREFIKQRSIIVGDSIYEELVYAVIKDERLPSGRTVAQIMKLYEDEEIKELFGDGFQDLIAEKDRVIAIKIPDMFYELNWDTDHIIPLVGVKTPSTLVKETYDGQYIFYYHSGYSELLYNLGATREQNYFKTTKYFYVYVKYATDHMLLHEETLVNEKGITLFEVLPQIEDCGGSALINRIMASGTRDGLDRRLIYINKRHAFKLWQETCGYKGTYLLDDGCANINCPRDCEPDGRAKNCVLDGVSIDNEIFIYAYWFLMRESENYSFQFGQNKNKDLIRRVVIPCIRHKQMGKVKVRFELDHKEISVEGNCFKVPAVRTTVIKKPDWIGYNKIGYIVFDDLTKSNTDFFWLMYRVDYDDFTVPFSLIDNFFYFFGFNREVYLNGSDYIDGHSGSYGWCVTGEEYLDGSFNVYLKF